MNKKTILKNEEEKMSSLYIKEINKTLRKNVVCCSISVVIYGFFQGTFSN